MVVIKTNAQQLYKLVFISVGVLFLMLSNFILCDLWTYVFIL